MAQPITSARIGPGHLVVGQILAGEDLHIAGRLRGSLDSTRTVVIEAGAICEAEITAQRVVIQGVVVGDVQAAGEVVVEPTGQVKGNIRASSVRVQLGGRIAGSVETGVEVRVGRSLLAHASVGRTTPRSTVGVRPEPVEHAPPTAAAGYRPERQPARPTEQAPAAEPWWRSKTPETAAAPARAETGPREAEPPVEVAVQAAPPGSDTAPAAAWSEPGAQAASAPRAEAEQDARTGAPAPAVDVRTSGHPSEATDEVVSIDDDGEGDSHDGKAAHHVVEIDSAAGVEAPADHVEVVEDDDLEGVRAP